MTDLGGKSRRYRPKVQYSVSAQAGKLRYFSDYNGTLIERIRRRRAASRPTPGSLRTRAGTRSPLLPRFYTALTSSACFIYFRVPLWVMLILGFIYSISISWNINGISHNFIHNPYFRSPLLNRLFSILESVTVGFSQIFYECIHIQHHKANPHRNMMEITPRISDKRANTRQ